jgi:hypothetical protein
MSTNTSRMRQWLSLSNYQNICLEGLNITKKNLTKDGLSAQERPNTTDS